MSNNNGNASVVSAPVSTVDLETLREVRESEVNTLYVDLDDQQMNVLSELGIDKEDALKMAASAFASVLRGKVQGTMDKAIKEKYAAESKGKKVLAEEFEKEIQKAIKLKRSIS